MTFSLDNLFAWLTLSSAQPYNPDASNQAKLLFLLFILIVAVGWYTVLRRILPVVKEIAD